MTDGSGRQLAADGARPQSLSPGERHRTIDFGGATDRPFRPFPDSWLDRPVFDILTDVASRHAERTAIDDGETTLTYRDVQEQARRLGGVIARQVATGAPVAICLPDSAVCPVAMLAALAAGRPFITLDATAPEARNALILDRAQAKAIIVDATTRDAAGRIAPNLMQIDCAVGEQGSDGPLLSASADDVALIVYTSGSEGQPKGVYHVQRNLLHKVAQRINWSHISSEDRTLQLFPVTSSAAQRDLLATLLSGASLFVVDLKRKGLQEVLRTIRRGRITLLRGQPYLYRRILAICPDRALLQSIREVELSGDPLFPSDLALLCDHFAPDCLLSTTLASTEGGTICHWFIPRDKPLDRPIAPVGYVLPGYRITLVNESGGPVPRGEIGEILIDSRNVALGYWGDEARTKSTFTTSPDDPKARILRTGDQARLRDDDLVEFIGRKGRRLRIRGQMVEPAEVEATIRQHRAIREAAVVPRGGGEFVEIVAYVVAEPSAGLAVAALSAWLAERLPGAMRPAEIVFLEEIPLLGNFKPDIEALRELDRKTVAARRAAPDEAGHAPPEAAPSTMHAVVGREWRARLGAASFAADRGWEESGGDSLKALEFMLELELGLGRPVPMSALRPTTRPSELIASLQQAAESAVHPDLFFFPGWRGAVLSTMRFVHTLSKDLRVKVLDYPRLDPLDLRVLDMVGVAAHCLAPIRAAARDGVPIRLIGYSYGGGLAVECARTLAAEGIEVGFLGIVDAPAVLPRDGADAPAHVSALRRLARRLWVERIWTIVSRPRLAYRRFLEEELRHRRFAALAWTWRLLALLPVPRARLIFLDTAMDELVRRPASMTPSRYYPGRMCVFRATDRRAYKVEAPADLYWGRFCEGVRSWPIEGDHISIFGPAQVEITTRTVIDAIAEYGTTRPGLVAPRSTPSLVQD